MGTQPIKNVSGLRAVELLSRASIFKSLTSEDKRRFATTQNLFQFAKEGRKFIEQGDHDHCIYIVMSGKANIYVDNTHVADIEAGQFVGEVAFVTEEPRTATVIAETDMVLLKINPDNFVNLPIRAREIIKDKIIEGLEQRISHMNQIIRKYKITEQKNFDSVAETSVAPKSDE